MPMHIPSPSDVWLDELLVERPTSCDDYLVPERVWITGDGIAWSYDTFKGSVRPSMTGGRSILGRFLRAASRGDSAILGFVREWGPLNLRRLLLHYVYPSAGLRNTDVTDFACSWLGGDIETLGGPVLIDGEAALWEPAAVYRVFAQHLTMIINLAFEACDRSVTDAAWIQRYPACGCCSELNPYGKDRAIDIVDREVRRLLIIGQVSYRLRHDSGRWKIETQVWNLLGVLALQTMLHVAHADGLYTCSGCGEPYIRSRATQGKLTDPSARNYCPDCGPPAAQLAAKNRRRASIREARRLAAQGLSTAEIASKLEKDPVMVERWVKGKVVL